MRSCYIYSDYYPRRFGLSHKNSKDDNRTNVNKLNNGQEIMKNRLCPEETCYIREEETNL